MQSSKWRDNTTFGQGRTDGLTEQKTCIWGYWHNDGRCTCVWGVGEGRCALPNYQTRGGGIASNAEEWLCMHVCVSRVFVHVCVSTTASTGRVISLAVPVICLSADQHNTLPPKGPAMFGATLNWNNNITCITITNDSSP
eukprot:1146981-Pelagomonas_calceolata.AAC.2